MHFMIVEESLGTGTFRATLQLERDNREVVLPVCAVDRTDATLMET